MMEQANPLCLAVLTVMTAAAIGSAEPENLVPNAGFEESVTYDPTDWEKGLASWRFYEIELPTQGARQPEGGVKGAAYRITGEGRAFLHSPFFDVSAGTEYSVALYAKDGSPQAELFWWQKAGLESSESQLSKLELKEAGREGDWVLYRAGPVAAPQDAAKAYMRIIADGALSVDEVAVTETAAE